MYRHEIIGNGFIGFCCYGAARSALRDAIRNTIRYIIPYYGIII